jgi:hypothetical protein
MEEHDMHLRSWFDPSTGTGDLFFCADEEYMQARCRSMVCDPVRLVFFALPPTMALPDDADSWRILEIKK